jgi:aminoglycoside phosphotransferase (APT) family kinase protein
VLALCDVAAYLLERKLVSARAVVDGSLRVEDVSRRNGVFVVTTGRERCLVLKVDGDARGTSVAHEAAVLDRLGSSCQGARLATWLPVPIAYDSAEGVLILEGVRDARDWSQHHITGRARRTLAREAGRALAALHAVPPEALDGLSAPSDPAWSLRLHRPDLEAVRAMSAASADLTRIVQQSDELCGRLDELLGVWQDECVIHADVRWDNCLALPAPGSARRTRLVLIDWELSAPGDPALDVGALFGEYLGAWLRSVPIPDPADPAGLVGRARFPIGEVHAALASFWDAYRRACGQPAAALGRTLLRAVRFAAVRVLAAALERAQALSELTPGERYAVQLTHNILARPDEAGAHLLGLRPSWASA